MIVLKNLVTSFLLASAIGLSACGGGAPADEPGATPPKPPARDPRSKLPHEPTTPPTKASADEVAMRPGLRLYIKPITDGFPNSEAFISVDVKSWQLGPAEVSYIVPPISRPATLEGSVRISEEARESGRAFVSPHFVAGGDATESSGPMIWLSQQCFRELKEAGETSIIPTSLPGGMPGGGSGGNEPMALKKTGEDTYTVIMTEKRLCVPVILAEDASGSHYKILDTPNNPLVVWLIHGPRASVGGKPLESFMRPGTGYQLHSVEPIPPPKKEKGKIFTEPGPQKAPANEPAKKP